MSEDFEGKLQDEGKKEGEGSDDDEDKDKDDEDAGEQMGDTGAEAEALDKEVTSFFFIFNNFFEMNLLNL